ncbi:MAG: HD domain-containing phosphohydrolase [Candidatus Omnitrophota bacterium]
MEKEILNNIFLGKRLKSGFFSYMVLPEAKFLEVSSSFLRILGGPRKSSLKKEKLDNLFAYSEEKDSFFSELKNKKIVRLFEAGFKLKDNKIINVAITAYRKAENKKNVIIEGIIEDVSSKKIKERQASLEKDFLQGLFDNIPDAIYFKDIKNRIIKVNKFYAQGLGIKSGDIIGKTDFSFFPPQQAKKMFDDDTYVISTGKPIVGKIERTFLNNGTWNQVITTKIPMYDRQGNIIGTMGTTRDMTAYANFENERFTMLMNALTVLGKALEMRDPYTFIHTQNVAAITEKIGRALNWDDNHILGMRLAGELHDLGKISIPLDILNKPGKLSGLEYQLIQEHVENCYSLIKDIKFPFPISDIIHQHHERLDGSGYPFGIKDDKIVYEAKILAVSDVLESMASHRPYRAALGMGNALNELETNSGIKYEPAIVELVKDIVNENDGQVFWLDSN